MKDLSGLVRPELWWHPVWSGGTPASADRSGWVRRLRRGDRVPAKIAKAVSVPISVAERASLERGRLATLALGVLGEWGHATAHQIAEIGGCKPSDVRNALYDMLGAGWVSRGQVGFYFDPWSAGEYWRLAGSRDLRWMLDRFTVADVVVEFGGRPLENLASGHHHARHDLFAVEVMLAVCARSPGVGTVLGPTSAVHERVLGSGDGHQAADAVIVRDDGSVVFIEASSSTSGGVKRMLHYAEMFASGRGAGAQVVFLDMTLPGDERASRNRPERVLAEVLAARPQDAGRLRDRVAFASWRDWFPAEGEFRPLLPVQVATNREVTEFREVHALGDGRPDGWRSTVGEPGWVSAHRQLGYTHFLLPRPEDPPLRWLDWVQSE